LKPPRDKIIEKSLMQWCNNATRLGVEQWLWFVVLIQPFVRLPTIVASGTFF